MLREVVLKNVNSLFKQQWYKKLENNDNKNDFYSLLRKICFKFIYVYGFEKRDQSIEEYLFKLLFYRKTVNIKTSNKPEPDIEF